MFFSQLATSRLTHLNQIDLSAGGIALARKTVAPLSSAYAARAVSVFPGQVRKKETRALALVHASA